MPVRTAGWPLFGTQGPYSVANLDMGGIGTRSSGSSPCWNQVFRWSRAWALVRLGEVGEARRHYDQGIATTIEGLGNQQGRDVGRQHFNFACLAALVGEREEALEWLRRALDAGIGHDRVTTDPDLASLRGDPELEAMIDGGG